MARCSRRSFSLARATSRHLRQVARVRARRHLVGSRMPGTLVAAHHFPCSLWVVPPLGLLVTHYVHLPPQARPPHTPPPALLQPAARARARRHSVGGNAWDFGRGSSLPLLTLGCPTTRAVEHTLCAPPTASAAPTHSPARPATASCARARARARRHSVGRNAWDLGHGS